MQRKHTIQAILYFLGKDEVVRSNRINSSKENPAIRLNRRFAGIFIFQKIFEHGWKTVKNADKLTNKLTWRIPN